MANNRKRLKRKRLSCAMCKPHKTGGSLRWKAKDFARLQYTQRLLRMKAYDEL